MDATTTLDLDAYLRRIGHAGDRTPTLSTLNEIVRGHAMHIPFENLNPLLGWGVQLDLPALETKLVAGGRGGYCFEHNTLFRAALERLGFETTGLAARVVWNAQPGAPLPPRTHMVVRVEVDGQDHVADVGFGGNTATAALRLVTDEPQATPHGRYRLTEVGGDLLTQVELDGRWRSMYRFDLVEQVPADYELMNHFTSTHPSSHFTSSLGVARAAIDGRWALSDRLVTFYGLDGTVNRRLLERATELRDVLEHVFSVRIPPGVDLEALFERTGPPRDPDPAPHALIME